jgi:hypothetical protein
MMFLDAPPRLIGTEVFSSSVLVADISELR